MTNSGGKWYRGLALDGESITFQMDVPNGGKDIQDEPVYWTLPGGKTVLKSAREVVSMEDVELFCGVGMEEYLSVAKSMGYACLGALTDAELEEFRADPGTLGGPERKWHDLKGECPANDMSPCWWVVMAGDLNAEPRLLCHSLMQVKLELDHHRMATPEKLTSEMMRRCDRNMEALEVIEDFYEVWKDLR